MGSKTKKQEIRRRRKRRRERLRKRGVWKRFKKTGSVRQELEKAK